MPHDPTVIPLFLGISTGYLVCDERPVLVDTGVPSSLRPLLWSLARNRVLSRDLSLILLTHRHSDHPGNAAALQELAGVPVAIHRADAAALHSGRNGRLVPTDLVGRLALPLMALGSVRLARPCQPDVLLEDGFDLTPFGVHGSVLHTPGHTAGSVTVVL